MRKQASPSKSKKNKQKASIGIAHVNATFNNTKVVITDLKGNPIAWCSAGKVGFKGARKSTPFAGQLVGEEAARKAIELGVRRLKEIRVKGPGPARESAMRAIKNAGLETEMLRDVTSIPFNGCRPRKQRRV